MVAQVHNLSTQEIDEDHKFEASAVMPHSEILSKKIMK